jgi:Skp family chaperone for outer membrane proteins
MKKLLILSIAGSALAMAAPAAAQYQNQGYANQGYANQGYANAGGTVAIGNRIAQLDARLQAGIQSGAISRQEAQDLRLQLRQLRQLERQYSRNGLTQQERQDLQQRLRSVRQQLRTADSGRYDQDTRYGSWDDGSYNQGGYAQGGYNNGYNGQGGYNSQGGYNNGAYGQGGPYQEADEVCQSRGGLGGVIDSVIGRDNCGGFQVGQRVSGGLYSVPNEYRYQYRDGNGVYYRSDGRQIYQIDARTNTVVRVYNMNR